METIMTIFALVGIITTIVFLVKGTNALKEARDERGRRGYTS